MSEHPDYGERAREWWRDLQNDTGARADLRRCRTPLDALLLPHTYALAQRLGWRGDRGERVGVLAAVLAHVRQDDEKTLARALGRSRTSADDARLSETRFRRLLGASGPAELQQHLTRLIALAGGRANIRDLTTSCLWWTDRTRVRWAADYYAANVMETEQ